MTGLFGDMVQLGVAGAALVTLIIVVWTMRSLTHDTLNFFGNHMTENVRQQTQTAKALHELTVAVRGLADEVRRG